MAHCPQAPAQHGTAQHGTAAWHSVPADHEASPKYWAQRFGATHRPAQHLQPTSQQVTSTAQSTALGSKPPYLHECVKEGIPTSLCRKSKATLLPGAATLSIALNSPLTAFTASL